MIEKERKEFISRYGIKQRKMERITCSNSGPTKTVKLRKKKDNYLIIFYEICTQCRSKVPILGDQTPANIFVYFL